MPNLGVAGALDHDRALRPAVERVLDQFVGAAGDLDRAALALRFHAAGDVHDVAPQIVDELLAADHARHHRPGVDADAEGEPPTAEGARRRSPPACRARDRPGPRMVGALGRYAGRDHVAVADGLDLLDTVAVDQAIEAVEDLVEQIDEFERRHGSGHRREVHRVREQDAGCGVVGGDGALLALQHLRDVLRQDVEQQTFRPLLEEIALADEVIQQAKDDRGDGADVENEEPRHERRRHGAGTRWGCSSAPNTSKTTKPTIDSMVCRSSLSSSEQSGQSVAQMITMLDGPKPPSASDHQPGQDQDREQLAEAVEADIARPGEQRGVDWREQRVEGGDGARERDAGREVDRAPQRGQRQGADA